MLFNVDSNRLRDRWQRMASALGLANDEQFVPLAMRHTFCSRLIEAGADIMVVKELAGHAHITTTQRYIHTTPEWLDRAIKKLELAG